MFKYNSQLLAAAAFSIAFTASACGGETANTNTPVNGGSTAPTANNAGENCGTKPVKIDPDAWKKVANTPPSDWMVLDNTARDEILRQMTGKLKGARFVACSGTVKQPHSTSTSPEETENEWSEWRDKASIGILYYVTDAKDAAAVLEKNGSKILEKTGANVSGDAKFASAKSGRVLVHAKSTKYGTYVLIGVAADDTAKDQLEGWAKSIKE